MQIRKNSSSKSTAILIVLIVLIAAVLGGFHWQRLITDTLVLATYHPDSTVQSLASETTMTVSAKRIFYVNHPQIQDKADFKNACPNGSEKTIVLGCYKPDQRGIFVLSVQDKRLQGVEQVTAAHEMLHAAYDRLSAKDKTYVDGLLEDYYKHDLHDKRILDTLTSYKKSEPGQQVNEMHSIFGTEVANLPPKLEQYYKRYFTDRHKITDYANQYKSEFTARQAEVAADDAKLAQIKKQVTADEAALNSKRQTINTDQARLNSYRSSGNNSAYNASVPAYNAEVQSYDLLALNTKSLIKQYNQLVNSRNAIVLEEQQLTQAIDANVTPIGQ